MFCELCKNKFANVHYTYNYNGVIRKINICEECMRKLKLQQNNASGDPFFGNTFQAKFVPPIELEENNCSECGLEYQIFLRTGKMGCASCYSTFREDVKNKVLPQIQKNHRYLGRKYSVAAKIDYDKYPLEETDEKKIKLAELEQKLRECIKKEDYMAAIKYRDEIKKLMEG